MRLFLPPVLALAVFLASYFTVQLWIQRASNQALWQKNREVLKTVKWYANHEVQKYLLTEEGKTKVNQFLRNQLASEEWDEEFIQKISLKELGEGEWFAPSDEEEGFSFILDADGKFLLGSDFAENAALEGEKSEIAQLLSNISETKTGIETFTWREFPEGPPRKRTVVYDYYAETRWIVGAWAWRDDLPAELADLGKRLPTLLALICALLALGTTASVALVGRRARILQNNQESIIAGRVNEKVAKRTRNLEKENEIHKRKAEESAKISLRLEEANKDLSAWVDELKQSSHEIRQLNKMSDLLQACRTVEETDRIIERLARELFPNDSGALCRYNDTQNILETVAIWGKPLTRDGDFMVEDCWALRRGKIYAVENPDAELPCGHIAESPANGYICLPMMAQGELMGLLHLQWGPPDPALSTEAKLAKFKSRKRLISTVTEQFTLSLANLKLREMLRVQSIRDPLTGLYNRRHMEESLAREIHRANRRETNLGLIMLDVDHFKDFNDNHGHDEGDVLLRELGAVLRANTRQEDIACRYGGEEFLIILPEAPLDVAHQRAELLRERIRSGLKFKKDTVTVSLGVAVYPDHGLTRESILNVVDQALYQAKDQGRDRVVVWEPGD